MEITLKLTFKKKADGSMLVRYGIPLWYRILAFLVLGILVASAILVGGTNALGIVILLIALLAAIYEESWTMDTATRTVRSRIGLLFLPKRISFSFDEVARVEINDFARGKLDQDTLPAPAKMPYGSQSRLIISLKNGESYMLNAVSFRKRKILEKDAHDIASIIGAVLT